MAELYESDLENATEIVLPGTVEPEDLQVSTRELPEPRSGQAGVRVEATGVSFAEQQMRRGKYYDQPPFHVVARHEGERRLGQLPAARDRKSVV